MASSDVRQAALAGLAPAAAIFAFGIIYGSLARPEMGLLNTILSSLLIFSGSVQFTIVALLSSGASFAALVAGATTLNLRNLILGAVMRPRVRGGRSSRAAQAWFLTDEAVGLALVSTHDPSRVLVVCGVMFYVSWQAGTLLGVLGASVDGLSEVASAVFPVLFIGLAALSSTSWNVAARAAVAAGVAAIASWLWPGSEAIVALTVAISVAVPERRR